MSYRVPMKPVLAAAALVMSGVPMMAAAQTAEIVADDSAYSDEDMMIIVGGIRDTKHVGFVDDTADPSQMELPTVYDDEPAPLDTATTPAD